MAAIAPEIAQQVNSILGSSMGPMGQWQEVEKILLNCGLAYTLQATPDLFLVHPLNRGGTGINPYSMHKKGATIIAAGADMSQLGGSVAFELSVDEVSRNKQILFNESMASEASNLLPQPTGKERYLTCSKGHTVQFCKAILQCCQTSQASIAGPSGCLGNHLLKDKQLACMLEQGWQWTIVKDVVAQQWPTMPSLIESAGNSSNSTYEVQNEVQLMSSIVLAQKNKSSKDFNYTKMAMDLCHGGPVQHYARHVGKFVQLYGGKVMLVMNSLHLCLSGLKCLFWFTHVTDIRCNEYVAGGPDGCMIDFVAFMSKQFGTNPTLGEEFMSSIVETQFAKTTLHPMVKIALVVTNCTTEKIVDSVAKLITKTDVAGLKAKKMHPKVNEVESLLATFWEQLKASKLEQPMQFKMFGKACIRFALHLTSKEKMGTEGKTRSMEELKTLMESDLATAGVGSSAASAASSTTAKPPAEQEVPYDLDQANNPMFLAKQLLDLDVGKNYTVKDQPGRIWALTEIGETHIVLKHYPLLEPTKICTMKFEATEIACNIKPTKQKMPKLFSDEQLQHLWASSSPVCQEETQKCAVFLVLHEAYNALDVDENQVLVQSTPTVALFAKKDLKKGALQLVPCPEKLGSIVSKQPSAKFFGEIKYEGTLYYIIPMKHPKWNDETGEYEGSLSPFWVCKEIEEGQLEYKWVTFSHKLGDIEIKILTNKDMVAAHSELGMRSMAVSEAAPSKKARKA